MSEALAPLTIRSATPSDVSAVFQLIQALADYEQLAHQVSGSADALAHHLFGPRPYVETLLAEIDGQIAGFALFFTSYSTFLTQPCLYLEDLFVLPDYRAQGVGKALLRRLAQMANERGYGRLEWSVLDWNEPAIAFYRRIGAEILADVRICRVAGDSLHQLASLETKGAVQPPTAAEVPQICELIQALAAFDGSSAALVSQPQALQQHLFQAPPYVEARLARHQGQTAGYATFSHNYSTFLTKPGIYLEDLFVSSDYRQQGLGKALLAHLAHEAIARDCGRLEWLVATWNHEAIAFYQQMGADMLPDWRRCQVTGKALSQLAGQA